MEGKFVNLEYNRLIKIVLLLFSCTVVCNSLKTPWAAAYQASLSFTISQSLLKLMSIELVMPNNHLVLRHPLLLPWIVPSIRDSSNESAICIRWPKYWHFSFSISPSNEYLGLISFRKLVWSPWNPRDSQKSSSTSQFESISSLVLSLLYGPTLTSVHDYWKSHSFDYTDLCQQSQVSAYQVSPRAQGCYRTGSERMKSKNAYLRSFEIHSCLTWSMKIIVVFCLIASLIS